MNVIEEKFSLAGVGKQIKKLFINKEKQLNADLSNLLAKYFKGQFARFLEERLRRSSKQISLIRILYAYAAGDDKSKKEHYDNIFEVLGLPMVEFFLLKTFGKASTRDKLRQMTPFLRKVTTGNSTLDKIIFNTLVEAVNTSSVRTKLKKELRDNINKVIDDLENDGEPLKDVSDFFLDKYGIKIPDDQKNQIDFDAIFDHKIKQGKQLNEFSKILGLDTKTKMVRTVKKMLPKLKRRLRKKIQSKIFSMDFNELKKIATNKDMDKLAEISVLPIVENIYKSAGNLYFKDESISEIADILEDVFKSKAVLNAITEKLSLFFQEQLIKTQGTGFQKK